MVDGFVPGKSVILIKDIKNQKKDLIKKTCITCKGSGKWINSFNKEDIRECFACKTAGSILIGLNVNDDNGKPVWEEFPKGTVGIIKKTYLIGKFNSYTKPDINNIEVFVDVGERSFHTKIFNLKLIE
jgi:hypothetical protein